MNNNTVRESPPNDLKDMSFPYSRSNLYPRREASEGDGNILVFSELYEREYRSSSLATEQLSEKTKTLKRWQKKVLCN